MIFLATTPPPCFGAICNRGVLQGIALMTIGRTRTCTNNNGTNATANDTPFPNISMNYTRCS